MAVTPKRMSLAEFLELPEVKPALELRHGMVSQKMPPKLSHAVIQVWFASQVDRFALPRKLARAASECRIILNEETYVPDVIVFRWDRIPEDENGQVPEDVDIAPDLALEILSPGQTVQSALERCGDLVAHGVTVVLLADPRRQTVRTVRASGEMGPLRGADAIDITDVVPGFEMSVNDLFICLRARPEIE
jgi:Uma2 family endonuclease